MRLLPDWKDIIRRAWSIKFLALAGAVAGCETVLQLGGAAFLPAWVAPLVTAFLTFAGIAARVLAQHEAEDIAKEKVNGDY